MIHRTIIIRRKFSAAEDDSLKDLVNKYGEDDWIKIASQIPNRSVRQCRERWNHYLAPPLVLCQWTKEEEELLARQVLEHGHQWKIFESLFPGRTDINIKNHYRVMLRREQKRLRILTENSSLFALMEHSSMVESDVNLPSVVETWESWDIEDYEWNGWNEWNGWDEWNE
jgi:hypothetical protein